jgi:hypothetical protein
MTSIFKTRRAYLALVSLAVLGCSGSDSEEAVESEQAYTFVPGMYRSEIVEVESDCDPLLVELIESTGQPKNGIVQLIWQSLSKEGPQFLFDLAMPRIDQDYWVRDITLGELETDGRAKDLTFFPGELILATPRASYGYSCAAGGGDAPTQDVRITQGSRSGEFMAEIETDYPDFRFSSCGASEALPRSACRERLVVRYELLRECPLNCTAIRSGEVVETHDVFPHVDGVYRDKLRPEELFQCVPAESSSPLTGGECPDSAIVP